MKKPEFDNEELKDCPFCGSKPEVKQVGGSSVVVICPKCKCQTEPLNASGSILTARVLAVDIWNSRVGGR